MYTVNKRISTSYIMLVRRSLKVLCINYKCRNYMYIMCNKCLMYIIHYNLTRSYSFIMIQLL